MNDSNQHDHHQGHHPAPHHRLFALLKPERIDIGIICFFSVITGMLYLATPLAVDAVVQNIAFGGQQQVYVQTLLIFSVALLVFLALLSMISAAQHAVAELIQQRIFGRVSADLAYRLPRLKLAALQKAKSVELINRFLDVTTLQKSSALILLDAVNVLLSALIGLVVLGFYHPFLLAFDFILVMALMIVFFGLGRFGVRTSIQESYAKHAVAGWFEQIVMFPLLFKWQQAKKYSTHMADKLVDDYLTCRKRHYRILLRQLIGLLSIQALASAGLLAIGGWLVLRGELTLGQLVASELIVSAIVAAVVNFGKHIEAWYDALAATDKLGSLVDMEIEEESGETFIHTGNGVHLKLENLGFSFGQAPPLFKGVKLEIGNGEIVGITGPVGAGTGTLLELLFGLRPVGEGMVFLNGQDIRHTNIHELRSKVVFIRGVELFEGSILENLALNDPSIPLSDVNEALNSVGLLERIRRMKDGLNSSLRPGGHPLSDSERVKLCMARAFLARPELILVDKILDGMDPQASRTLFQTVFAKDKQCTILIATRDRDLLQHCSRVFRLQTNGVKEIPPGSLAASHGEEAAS
ncbi:MAG: peptidase domain-containing ABC transporter [Verrucomicrobiota bacterium]